MNLILKSKTKKDIENGAYVVTWNKRFSVEERNQNLFL